MDNPFGTGNTTPQDPPSTPPDDTQPPADSPKELTEAEKEALAILERDSKPPEVVIPEPPKPVEVPESVKIMDEVLAEYNYIESDIPLSHPKYWAAKQGIV